MVVPLTGEVFQLPEVVSRFVAFLRELTGDLPPAEVYAAIVEKCETPDHDPRIDQATPDPEEFAAVWSALVGGVRVPEDAWESVVLPAVVAFSTATSLKAHLELATSFWVAARGAADHPAVPSTEDSRVVLKPSETVRLPAPEPLPPVAPRRRRAWWIALLIVVLIGLVAAAGFRWVSQHRSLGPKVSTLDTHASPDATVPSATTASGTQTVPAPAPTWTGTGPKVAPGAPTGLVVLGVTKTTVSLSWLAPADPGTGGIAYYAITANGLDAGWTAQTSVTLTGLKPGTSYSVAIIAHNNAGLSSPAGTPVIATTASPGPATPPPGLTPTVTLSPGSTVPLGDSFTVSGSGWTCSSPAQVEVQLRGKPIATATTDDSGSFTAPVMVYQDHGPDPYVVVVGSGEELQLAKDTENLLVRLTPRQVQCPSELTATVQITFS